MTKEERRAAVKAAADRVMPGIAAVLQTDAAIEKAARSSKPPVKQVAYLAGPMRGYPEYNFPAFHAAAAKLRAHGLDVWSPAEHDVNEDGFDPAKDTAQPMLHYMRRDLPAVLDADMVCVLEGWEKSQGARLEVTVALTCGLPVYRADNMQPVTSVPSEKKDTQDAARYRFLRSPAVMKTAGYSSVQLMKLALQKFDVEIGPDKLDELVDEAMNTHRQGAE